MECRFCLMPYEQVNNPLLSPCACKGSAQYVHKLCLRKWRHTTENPDFIHRCQICLENYKTYVRWPIEIFPHPGDTGSWFLLSRSGVITFIIYFINFLHYVDLYKTNQYSDFLTMIIMDRIAQRNYFLYSLVVTSLYGMFYYSFWKQIRSKHIYIRYWMRSKILNYNPRMLLSYALIIYCVSLLNVYPFGVFYLHCLPQFFKVHTAIIMQMNNDAQII
jgi:hypothetical protein